ncbi:hypothetical protein GCM10023206_26400 [Acinetobacter puyangensis]|nr:hypothetical protein [Acinetobacter puyangensis]
MMGYLSVSLRLSALTVALLTATSATFALEKLDDATLADATGEGIAFLPENSVILFRGTDVGATESTTTILTDRTHDTGYINFIPVGPLTTQAAQSGAGKADVYLYGLAISKGDGDLNRRLNAVDPIIRSWGTADNPWLFKVETEHNVPNFAPTGTDSVTYLALETPLHHLYTLDYTDSSKNVINNIPSSGETGADAYNLKLAMWADAFVLDPRKSATDETRYHYNYTSTPDPNRANRLRLQVIWDGLSINGSDIRLFQTLGGATGIATSGNAKDTAYNHTLGLAGVLRFNSGDTRNLKASRTNSTVTRAVNNVATMRYTTTYLGRPGASSGGAHTNPANLYRLRTLDTRDDYSASSWTMPSLEDIGVLRLSTRETGATQGILDSPAINAVNAPNFDANEGLHLYGTNINLVLGSLYQPLILNKDTSSNNLVLELAAIPNKADIYKQIYTAYSGYLGDATASEYKGSTCNVYACGTPIEINGVKTYQGNNATHSSISIGTTEYDPNTGLMTAFKGTTTQDSIGVSFGALSSSSTAAYSRYYYQLQQQTRNRNGNNRWNYINSSGGNWAATNNCNETNGGCYQFNNTNVAWQNVDSFNVPSIVSEYNPTTNHGAVSVTGQTNPVVPAWNALPTWDATTGSGANFSGTTWTSNPAPTYQSTISASPSNNLGSVVIDGMLIQHMKITTKGL